MNARWMGWGAVVGLMLAGMALAAPQRDAGITAPDRTNAVVAQAPDPSTEADEEGDLVAELLAADEDDPGAPELGGGPDGPPMGPGMGMGRHGYGRGMGGPGMGRGRGHGGMMGGPGPRMLEQLDLTAAQREKITAIHDRQARKAITLRAELETAGLDLRKLLRADDPDRGRIDAQLDKIAAIRGEMAKTRIATRLDTHEVLTPEQRDKAKALHQGRGWGTGNPGGRTPDAQGSR